MKSFIVGTCISGLLFIGGTINLNNLPNYANQPIPSYITKDNTPALNPITDEGATLGRVLFYDKKLSVNDSIACSNCHMQAFAFTDTAVQSLGLKALTLRHSMRLVNMRFASDAGVLWAKSVANQEAHNTLPFKGDAQMGFSGLAGAPDFDSLIAKMEATTYYPLLFETAFGDPVITELKITAALSQFVRSIQSFDSKYDTGRAMVSSDTAAFPNFTATENQGKDLYMRPAVFDSIPDGMSNRIGGGVGCASCHRPPEFDIDPNSLNNGLIQQLDGSVNPLMFRSPTLRDMLAHDGSIHSPFMHDGGGYITDGDVASMLDHYNQIVPVAGTDIRLAPGGFGQQLHLTSLERAQLTAFFRTLTGSNLYMDIKWSDPFQGGQSPLINKEPNIKDLAQPAVSTPFQPIIYSGTEALWRIPDMGGSFRMVIYDWNGRVVLEEVLTESSGLPFRELPGGLLIVQFTSLQNDHQYVQKMINPLHLR